MNDVFPEWSRGLVRLISVVGLIGTAGVCLWLWQSGAMTDSEELQMTLSGLGPAAVPLFVLVQVVQVVIPILPGGISLLAGVVLFGPLWGFVWNYLGICLGSILIFLLGKRFGRPLLFILFDGKTIERYDRWATKGDAFTKMFAVAIFLPLAPDDFLCLLAGTTPMKLPTFVTIILLGKPMAIAAYSIGLKFIWERLLFLLAQGG